MGQLLSKNHDSSLGWRLVLAVNIGSAGAPQCAHSDLRVALCNNQTKKEAHCVGSYC
jgi:hypothetical protein